VNYHYLVIRDSIEHRLMELIDEKKGNESLVIDGRKVPVSTLLVPLVSPD
jgi:hypothetical protein